MQGESILQTLQLSSILFPSYSCSRDQTLGSERCVPCQLKLDIFPPLALTKTSETSSIGDMLSPTAEETLHDELISNNTNSCKQEFLQQTVARNEDCALQLSLREVEICSCKLLKFTNQSPQLLFFPSCSNSFSFQPPLSQSPAGRALYQQMLKAKSRAKLEFQDAQLWHLLCIHMQSEQGQSFLSHPLPKTSQMQLIHAGFPFPVILGFLC